MFNIFLNNSFYSEKQGNVYDYAADNSVSMNHNELNFLSWQLQAEAEVMGQWFSDNAMEAKLAKFQGSLLKNNKQANDFKVSVQGDGIEIDYWPGYLRWWKLSVRRSFLKYQC